ncbi:N-carbamoyl-L-amino-acid hydrolase [Kineococcus radiotolerans]|uniref:N-carbamoyl-L-amino-acid hydrolase n=1 Tax=Kineococcus radiotolerans TaxID=131568 RepID=A0A7W4TQQ1_KINRA|nr:M20 family metallo-hydrolase [Kineococcus radiotolerans]MBB2903353.1 N-carbamoyl-L-amino-acid hydrolase [Kineococcus radiotolerans]
MTSTAFLEDFAALSAIGATPAGGVDRQAATAADGMARRWFIDWLRRNDLYSRVDQVGNVFGTADLVPGADHVLMGSHLDSQPLAGRFDGAYGVLAAAYAVRAVAAQVASGEIEARYNLTVVNWFNEEGSRFQPSLMGSSVYTGAASAQDVLATTDETGATVGEALQAIGFLGSEPAPTAACYAEVHIEQGRVLERLSTDIGVVEENWAARKYEVVVHGAQGHTGATAMADRRDALVTASRLVCLVRDLVEEYPDGALLSAVGRLTVLPNSPVVVPREVSFHLDLRSHDATLLEEAHTTLMARFEETAGRGGVDLEFRRATLRPSTPFPAAGVDLVEQVAKEAGASTHRMRTMAGHDAVALNAVVPTVLMFVPSVDGISHHEAELTRDEDLLRGVDVLTGVCARLVAGEL